MSKELWIKEHEAVGEDFVSGLIDEETARLHLKELGFDQIDIDNEIDALKSELEEVA